MWIRSRLALAALLTCLAGSVSGDGINNAVTSGNFVGQGEGINNVGFVGGGGGGPPPTTCSGTGLDFSVDCNSQYIGLL